MTVSTGEGRRPFIARGDPGKRTYNSTRPQLRPFIKLHAGSHPITSQGASSHPSKTGHGEKLVVPSPAQRVSGRWGSEPPSHLPDRSGQSACKPTFKQWSS
jgi:hypothetical protein